MIKPLESYDNARAVFLSHATVRRKTVLVLFGILLLVACVSLAVARQVEGRDQFTRLIAMSETPGAIDLLSGLLPQGVKRVGGRRISVEKTSGIQVIMAKVSVACSFAVLRAVNEEGKLLNVQWDYRYVRNRDPGEYWFATYVSPNMGYLSEFHVELLGDPACVSVNKWLLIPVKNTHDWPYLLYNDGFRLDENTALPLLINGYDAMPIDGGSLPLPQ